MRLARLSPACTLVRLSSCAVVSPAPDTDKVHLTQTAADVAACTAAGRVRVPDTNGQPDLFNASATFRNQVIGLGGNTAFLTSAFVGTPTEGVAYKCK